METSFTTDEWEAKFGGHIKNLRLRQNLDQKTLAAQAGVGLTALKNLENGNGCTLKTVIKVLRAMEKVEWLETLAPAVSISPMQMLKSRPERQRAYSPHGTRKKEQ